MVPKSHLEDLVLLMAFLLSSFEQKGVHKYAVVIKYYHADYSALCPSHPYHKKDIGPYPVFGAIGKEVVSVQTN